MNRSWTLRSAVLLSAGALGVHELRYAVTFGPQAREALGPSHGYLAIVTPPLVLLGVLALALLVGGRGRRALARPSFGRLWAVAAAVLAGVHFTQESLEQVLGGGASPFGPGAAVALAAAVVIGAVVAVALRGSAVLDDGPALSAPRPSETVTVTAVLVAAVSRLDSRPAERLAQPRAPPFALV